jgi:hypothetical protein
MNINGIGTRLIQCTLSALLLLLVVGCSSTTTDDSATSPRPPATLTIRESQVMRMGVGGVGQGTLIYLGWQHKFEIKNMILGGIDDGEVEIKGDVWNLEKVEDFAGTYHTLQADIKAGKGLSGVWLENENGVRVNVRSEGQDISINLHSDGSTVTLKD